MIPYKNPMFLAETFNCPHCQAYANQKWFNVCRLGPSNSHQGSADNINIAQCSCCQEYTIWVKKQLVYPFEKSAPYPNPDLPEDITFDYEEARDISSMSPRGAAALLRLAIQKLCKHLGESGENINADIASLVKKGLPTKIQQALDIVRVVGNNAVHPGQIDLNDDIETVKRLFGLVNIISEVMITQPKQIDELYEEKIPESLKEAIRKRDGVS